MAEARRWAAIPRRPAWRDSDPRWRRRMLVGAWILVLLPLMDALTTLGWASKIPVPTIFDHTVHTLDETLFCFWEIYLWVAFCIGVALLFSKERGRRRGRMDWTRRWGVACTYVVLLLRTAQLLFIAALVLAGVASLFLSMPLKYQPSVTQWFVDVSTTYLRYGPSPKVITDAVLIVFSSTVILLACVPLYDALRSSGPKRLAAILIAPLAFFSLMHLEQAGRYCLGFAGIASRDLDSLGIYFRPQILVESLNGKLIGGIISGSVPSVLVAEATKWVDVLIIALWLSIAQFAARRHSKNASAASPTA